MTELFGIRHGVVRTAIGLVAFLHSSVGHCGAAGYLVAAASLGLAPAVARPGARWLDRFVTGGIRWRGETRRRALAVLLWSAASRFILTGK